MIARTKRHLRPAPEPLEGRALLSAGDLDPTLGTGGIVTTGFNRGEQAWTVLPQPDGKIVAVGQGNMARYLANGSLDGSFGRGGKVALATGSVYPGFGAALYPPGTADAGKIVAVGQVSTKKTGANFAVTRYLASGAVDPSFGSQGTATTDFAGRDDGALSVAIQPDGKAVVAGYYRDATRRGIGLARYNTNGSLDTSFGTGGKVLTPTLGQPQGYTVSVAVQPDGKIAVATTAVVPGGDFRFTVARYTAAGALDPAFGPAGAGFVQIIDQLADHPGVGTNLWSDSNSLAHEAVDVAVQPDGKIVAVGTTAGNSLGDGWLVARFDTAGNLDPGFGIRGTTFVKASTDPNGDSASGVALQADGKVVVTGGTGTATGFYVARFDTAGALDATFGSGGITSTLGAYQARDMAIQPDGKIVVAGAGGGFALARYLADAATSPMMVRSVAPAGLGLMGPGSSTDGSPASGLVLPLPSPARLLTRGRPRKWGARP